jgi:hypothetical protein
MATWKKVIVSGSDAILNQLNVGTNQQISTAQSTTFLTGSFSGSFTGDGSALTGITQANNTLIALTAGTGLSGGGSFRINQAQTEEITFGNAGVTSNVAGGGISVSGATGAVTIAVNSGSMLPFISSSIFNTISGDVLVDASGVATIQANSVALGTDTTGNYVATINPGAGLTGGSTSGEGVAHTLAVGAGEFITVNTNDVDVKLTALIPAVSSSIFARISGDIAITELGVASIGSGVIVNADIADSTIDLTAKVTGTLPAANGGTGINSLGTGVATFLGTPSSANLRSALTDKTGTGVNVFAASPTFTGTVTADNLNLSGDLTVNGTLTTLATTNVSIKDQFITIASGSQSATDGGIIVSKQANGSGFAFGYDASETKWVLQNNAAVGATTLAADAFIGIVSASAAVPTANPAYGGATGYGNIHVKTDTGDIWIYA